MQYLGQHFLRNEIILKEIADSLALKSGDVVIEIGPGHGELTGELLKHPITVVAIEKDAALVDFLTKNFQFPISNFQINPELQLPKLQIIHGDVLKALPSIIKNLKLKIKNSNYSVVGDIPYYITGYLLRVLSETKQKPKIITLLIQKEVAERIVAEPPKMNLLAAITQSWSVPNILRSVGRKEFSPPPKVDSAIITLIPRSLPSTLGAREAEYYRFLRTLFKQPRKTIANNLTAESEFQMPKNELTQELKQINVNPGDRPQSLSLEDVQNLFKKLYNSR